VRWFETQIRLHTVLEGAFALLLLTPAVVYATLPVVTEIKHFRDFRGPNNIQVATGDRVEIGANSVVPSEGTTGQAVQNGVTLELRRDQRCTKPDEISRSRVYDANLVGAWTLTFTHAGTSTDPIDTHAIGSAELIPLAEDLAVVGLGTRTPTPS
jgi:hypothetical protein